MIQINDLSKVFRTSEVETVALNHVSLDIEEGVAALPLLGNRAQLAQDMGGQGGLFRGEAHGLPQLPAGERDGQPRGQELAVLLGGAHPHLPQQGDRQPVKAGGTAPFVPAPPVEQAVLLHLQQ